MQLSTSFRTTELSQQHLETTKISGDFTWHLLRIDLLKAVKNKCRNSAIDAQLWKSLSTSRCFLAHEHDLGSCWRGKVKNKTSKLHYVIEHSGSFFCLPPRFFPLDRTVFYFYLQIAGLCVILFCLGEDSQVLSAPWSQQATRYRTPSLETSQWEKWGLTGTSFGVC